MNPSRLICGIASGIIVLIGVTGCVRGAVPAAGEASATSPTTPTSPASPTEQDVVTSLSEARKFQNAILEQLVEFVPPELITGGMTEPIPEMRGLSCKWSDGSDDARESEGVFLPGGYDVEVANNSDLSGVMDEVFASYEGNPEWIAESSGEGDERLILLTSMDGYTIYVRQYAIAEDTRRFSLSSFSPCIRVSEEFDLFGYH